MKAVENVNNQISKEISLKSFNSIRELDETLIVLDGTPNKAKLGANAILGVSMATVVALASKENMEVFEFLGKDYKKILPTPMMNIINGGSHADNNVDIQEFMIVPVGAPNVKEAIRMGAEVFHHLKKILSNRGLSTSVGDEGGYAPNLVSNEAAIQVILEAIEKAGYTTEQIKIALDVASSEFFKDGKYQLT